MMAQTRLETGLPGRPSTGVGPMRPNISGLPGRMAIFQKSSVMPCCAERALDQIVIADRGAAGGDQKVGPGRAGDRRCSASRVGGDAEVDGLGPATRRKATRAGRWS